MKYYPTEFIAAMLNSVIGINEKVAYYIRFAKEIGIELLPPNINEGYSKFTVKGDNIYFGLASVKNVGVNVIENIVKARNQKGSFTSLVDFCNKIEVKEINKRAVESLIKAGAFDSLKVYRSRLLAVHEKILDSVSSQKKKNIEGQLSLFADFSEVKSEAMEIKYPEIKEFEKKYLLSMEKEMTGIYISGHPLDEYKETLDLAVNTKISDLIVEEALEGEVAESYKVEDGARVIIGGIISEVSKKITRNNAMMAFVKVEDMYGSIEVVIFPKVLEKCISFIAEDSLVIVSGRVSVKEDEQPKILAEDIKPLLKINEDKIYILIEEQNELKAAMKKISTVAINYRGDCPIYICTKKERKKFLISNDLRLDSSIDSILELKGIFGEENIKVQK